MDQQRLFIAIAISVAILLGFQLLIAPHLPQPPKPPPQVASSQTTQTQAPNGAGNGGSGSNHAEGAQGRAAGADRGASSQGLDQPAGRAAGRSGAHRLSRDAGAQLSGCAAAGAAVGERALLRSVRWSAGPGEQVELPDDDTVWASSGGTLTAGNPVTLKWDNGAGLTFQIAFKVDDDYMFTVRQSVQNATGDDR